MPPHPRKLPWEIATALRGPDSRDPGHDAAKWVLTARIRAPFQLYLFRRESQKVTMEDVKAAAGFCKNQEHYAFHIRQALLKERTLSGGEQAFLMEIAYGRLPPFDKRFMRN